MCTIESERAAITTHHVLISPACYFVATIWAAKPSGRNKRDESVHDGGSLTSNALLQVS